MIVVVLSCVVGLVLVVVRVRRRRKTVLAGLDAAKPAFTVEPPVRSMVPRGDHRW